MERLLFASIVLFISGLVLFCKDTDYRELIKVGWFFTVIMFLFSSGSMQAVGLATVGVIGYRNADHEALVAQLHNAMFGNIQLPEMQRVHINKVQIKHYETDLRDSKPLPVRKVDGIEYNDEHRYCLASLLPQFKTSSFTIKGNDRPSSSELYTFFNQSYYETFGGTGLNKNQFYATQGMDYSMFNTADETVSYLSLLFTPLALGRDKKPFLFKLRTLILTDKEMRATGLVEGNTGIIINKDISIQGQFRLFLDDNGKHSIGKGAAFNFDELAKIGIKIEDRFFDYDIILSESHVKVNKVNVGDHYAYIGFTYDNTWTVSGSVGHSFEFYQYLKFNKKLMNMLTANFIKVDYSHLLVGDVKGKVIAAAKSDSEYRPTELDTAIQNGFIAFGPNYPAVSNSLQRKMLQYLINSAMPESNMRLVVMCTDEVHNAVHLSKSDANSILYKYPITAGLGKAFINADLFAHLNFYAIQESTCIALNIDGDGDIAEVNQGEVTNYIIDHKLIKPLRDISVHGREKNSAPYSLANIAKIMSRILKNNGLIGQLTMAYYRAEIGKELLDDTIDLTPYYQGIESVIKSNKWDMDLSILETRNFEQEKELRGLVADNWRESKYLVGLNKMFDKSDVDLMVRIDAFNTTHKVADPQHYMDNLWNHTLDKAKVEVEILRKNQKPLSWFQKMIQPQLILDTATHAEELLVIKQLNYLFNNSIEKTQAFFDHGRDIINIIQSMEFSLPAMSDYLDGFFSKSKGTGMFPLYWNNLSGIVDGGINTMLKTNKDKIAQSIKSLFGEIKVDINHSILATGDAEVTIWRGRNGFEGRTIIPAEMIVDTEVTVYGKAVTGFNASVNGNIMDGKYLVVKSTDKFNKNGSICETGISVTLQRVA